MHTFWDLGWGASMGPRARARGNAPRTTETPCRCSRFNGATSARSWKLSGSGYARIALTKLQWGHERALVEMRRGCWGGCFSLWLQWGHERALVEMMNAPTGPSACSAVLQWGHERALVEMWMVVVADDASDKASMGPRARARGNGAAGGRAAGRGTASMGPRARARGNVTVVIHYGDFATASMGPRARARGNSAGWTAGCLAKCTSFNGATSARSWKSAVVKRPRKEKPASMGPRARARGNQAQAIFSTVCLACFNGATSARSWKYGGHLRGHGSGRASMGPRARARGNAGAGRPE